MLSRRPKCKRREDAKPPGPAPNPIGLRQLRLFEAQGNRESKFAKKVDPDNCDFVTARGQSCCKGKLCSVAGHYDNNLVRHLRIFLNDLSFADWTVFIDQRTTYNPRADELKGRPGYEHFMEDPVILSARLVAAGGTQNIPRPNEDDLIPVCSRWFRWAVGLSGSVLDYNARVFGVKHRRDFEPSHETNVGKPYFRANVRASDKTDSVKNWFAECRELYLILPNDDTTILPFGGCKDAHANYVLDMEEKAGCAWAETQRDIFNMMEAARDAVEDANGVLGAVDVEGPPVEDAPVENANEVGLDGDEQPVDNPPGIDANFRYGNSYLTCREDARPEQSNIAGYLWFCRVWRTTSSCAMCKVCLILECIVVQNA